MILTPALKTKLLGAIETNTLVFLCGAGLSMAAPTNLPSAVQVAQACYDKWIPNEALDVTLRNDVDKLAGHFHSRGDFESVFIPLVPWNDLVGAPNAGHAAIGDFLVSRAARGALSANFDPMIENWAEERKIAMRGALTGQEATDFEVVSNPLLKFHGCSRRDREKTLWTESQLDEPVVKARIKSFSDWITLHLPGKHIVVIGFWTDWGYLNDVLADAFTINNANSVTVVDPTSSADLETKAPDLWRHLNALSRSFEHIQVSGADFLEELRTEYSKSWVRKFYALGAPLVHAAGAAIHADATPYGLSGEHLYDFRRDAEGIPYVRAATLRVPEASSAETAYARMALLNAGATNRGPWLEHSGKLLRIINGAGKGLADVQNRYKEPVSINQADFVVCVGARKLGVPATLIATGRGSSIVRPASGIGSTWLTFEEAQVIFGL